MDSFKKKQKFTECYKAILIQCYTVEKSLDENLFFPTVLVVLKDFGIVKNIV